MQIESELKVSIAFVETMERRLFQLLEKALENHCGKNSLPIEFQVEMASLILDLGMVFSREWPREASLGVS